ncbi:hypothetical protein MTO96_020953 [Rhipicephalus appendiculatus]
MTKLLVVLLRRVTIAVWVSFTSLLIYFLLTRRNRGDTTWSQPPPAAATAAATNLRLLASASGGAFGTLPRAPCPSFLAVVVSSAPDHAPERQAIRDTWARDAQPGHSAVYFLLGRHAQDATGRRSVVRGRERRAAFENDTRRGNGAGFLLGKRHESKPIGRNYRRYGRPAGSSWVPTYLSGAAYVMSGAIAGPMLRKALETPALHHENVFLTGIVASKLNVRLFHSPCFACCDELADPCAYRGLLAATVAKSDTLRIAWKLARGHAVGGCVPRNDTDRLHC